MVVAQTILVTPIIAALARQAIEDLWQEYRDELTAMNVAPFGRVATLIWEGRFSLVVTLLAGFGRVHVRVVPCDRAYEMRASVLAQIIARDVEAGMRPCALSGKAEPNSASPLYGSPVPGTKLPA